MFRLIVGLGNPGSAYEETRHNVGFKIASAFANKHAMVLRKGLNGLAAMAQGRMQEGGTERKIVVLLPLTYMNSSGEAVRIVVDYFKVSVVDLLVVSDDVAFDLGVLRLRKGGSSGGHNGLKSIETHLGTQEYPRLRVGVGNHSGEGLADYVLGSFAPEQREKLEAVIDKAVSVLDAWVVEGLASAQRLANTGD
jgi:peptidyl-tRNA hydrolase, PTH1 family